MTGQRVLLVGSQGYLGSRLADFLLDHGYDCHGVDTGFFRDGLLYEPAQLPMLDGEARTLSEDDIKGFDVVVQLAGISNDPLGGLSPEGIYGPTRHYAVEIARLCKLFGVRYLFPSSCSVYGIAGSVVDEESPVNPRTPYSVNKVQIEEDLAELADESFSPIALRLATVFGASPRIRFDVVVNMLCGMAISQRRVILNSDGSAWRPHVDIEDVCEAFRCCIDWDYDEGRLLVLNVGRDDNNWKILDLAKLIQSRVPGCELSYLASRDGKKSDDLVRDRKVVDGVDERTYRVAFGRAHDSIPGYQAVWNVESGVDRLLAEFDRLSLDEATFHRRVFYRLQQLEMLYEIGQLDDQLQLVRAD